MRGFPKKIGCYVVHLMLKRQNLKCPNLSKFANQSRNIFVCLTSSKADPAIVRKFKRKMRYTLYFVRYIFGETNKQHVALIAQHMYHGQSKPGPLLLHTNQAWSWNDDICQRFLNLPKRKLSKGTPCVKCLGWSSEKARERKRRTIKTLHIT